MKAPLSPSPIPPSSEPALALGAPVEAHVHISRALAVGSLLGLIVISLVWELLAAPLRPGGSWLALKALPLCLPLAGLLKNRMYTYRWVSMLVWLYFTEGVVRAWGDKAPGNYCALLEIALCLVLFVACLTHVRLRQRDAKAAGLNDAPATEAS